MDAIDQLALCGEIGTAVAVIGRGEEYRLVELGGDLDTATVVREANSRDWLFCGLIAMVDGVPQARTGPRDPRNVYTMSFARLAYAHQMSERTRAQTPTGDTVEWLKKLHSLPDTRVH